MVLEVGPGTGNMTVKLLEKCKKVFVIFSILTMHAYIHTLLNDINQYNSFPCITIGDDI